jgi:actin-related protein 8
MINQKNYYTEFLKREEQFLAFRAPAEEATARMVQAARDRDRALAFGATPEGEADQGDESMMEDVAVASTQADISKLVVLHVGSQNLRIGLGTDALPKTVPMVIARRWPHAESEEDDGQPSPKRQKVEGAVPASALPEKWFGEDVRTSRTPSMICARLMCSSSQINTRPCALRLGRGCALTRRRLKTTLRN